jgi:hypothetical protein
LFDFSSNVWIFNKDALQEESLRQGKSFDFSDSDKNEFTFLVIANIIVTDE